MSTPTDLMYFIDALVITIAGTVLEESVKGNTFQMEPIGNNRFIFLFMGLLFTFDESGKESIIHETYKSYRLRKLATINN